MDVRPAARGQLPAQRGLQTVAMVLVGAIGFAGTAVIDATSVIGAAVFGGLLSGTWFLLRYPPTAPPAGQVDPACDPDGLLRTILSAELPEDVRIRLAARAGSRPLRFRAPEDALPVVLLLVAVALAGLWLSAEPRWAASRRPVPQRGGAAAGTPAQPDPAAIEDRTDSASGDGPNLGAEGEWPTSPSAVDGSGAILPGAFAGSEQVVLERYLRLRANHER